MIGRFLAACAISMSDLGDWCCEAGMGGPIVTMLMGSFAVMPANAGITYPLGIDGERVPAGAGTAKPDHVSLAPVARPAALAHSPAASLGPSACTRRTLKRPSAQTMVMPSASTATISPILPAIPLGSLAGTGFASKIFRVLPSSVDHAPGAGLQPRITRSIS